MQTKIVRRAVADASAGLSTALHPVLARVYAARGVCSAEELDYSLGKLLPFETLLGMEDGVRLLQVALRERQRILVIGDFDADGATSCALAVRALRAMGAAWVDYLVPNRFEYGYGLTPEIVEVAAASRPDLLITVDNGISSISGVEAAHKHGAAVLITDHHLPGAELPSADAIVNPNQPGDPFPSKNLAGVGVMFYVLMALRARLRERGWFKDRPEPNLAQYLDLVALGTVADVVPLDRNNRILVAQGLARIRSGRCQPGVRALLEVARRAAARTVSSDLAFAVAPRLNAAGRLSDMSLGIECLLTDDQGTAMEYARRLEALNCERREIEAQMRDQALESIDTMQLDAGAFPYGLCLYESAWHQGLVGIVAGRVKDRLNRPVIAFASAEEQGYLKGSARSVPGFHIRDALDAIATRYPKLIARFGGHAMAAGLSLRDQDLDAFKVAFDEQARRCLEPSDLTGTVYSDGELAGVDVTLAFAQALRDAGPWGQGFPEPMFDGMFDVAEHRILQDRHVKLGLQIPGKRRHVDAIAFNVDPDQWPSRLRSIRCAYRLDVNEFRGARDAQLIIEHVEALE